MFDFEVTSSICRNGECPCDEAFEVNDAWAVSFHDMKELLSFIEKYGDVIITQNGNNLHILNEHND